MTCVSFVSAAQVQSPHHVSSGAGFASVLQSPKSDSYSRNIPGQQGSISNDHGGKLALPPSQWKDKARDPMNRRDHTVASASSGAGTGSGDLGGGGGGYSLDGKGSESLSFLKQARLEHGSAAQLRQKMITHSSALLRRQGTGSKQTSEDSKLRSQRYDMGPQQIAPSYNKPTDTARLASQHAVQEALEASLSTAVSAGDDHMVEIFKNMQGQLLKMRT
jgi:hypothetical protein